MSASPSDRPDHSPAFDLKGSSFTLPVLQLLNPDMAAVSRDLGEKVGQAPEFFQNAPVVIDLQHLGGSNTRVDFALLVGLLRGHGMIPVGVRGGNEAQNQVASAMELAILAAERSERPRPAVSVPAGGATTATPAASAASASPKAASGERVASTAAATPSGTRMINHPVRSGQRIFVQGGDLVVLASVSSGAELLAEGNIHVYGTLRGRALAGIKGDMQARIFCQGLEAELVSIAGHYRVSEDLDETLRSKAVQIFLDGQRLAIQAL